ncbi:MAG: hypothetical protein ACP6IP_04340 [Candidatus Njordarchaeia archaeon]
MKKVVLTEEDLHEIIIQYPEIIIPAEDIIDINHEKWESERSRADIHIKTRNMEYIVEIKNREIKYRDILQTARYLADAKTEGRRITPILVGKKISEETEKHAEKLGIAVKIIGREIPKKLKVCGNCKTIYNYEKETCPKCGSKIVQLTIELV